MLDLTLLGCGGNAPMPNRHLSSLILNYKGVQILFDCGEGTQVAMKKNCCGFKDLDLILISHLHGDHIFGLMGLLVSMGTSGKTNELVIVGPRGVHDMISNMRKIIGLLPFKIAVIENPKNVCLTNHPILKELEISTMILNHNSECMGYRLDFKRKPEFSVEKARENNVPLRCWNRLQHLETATYEGKTYTPDMVLGKERNGLVISLIGDTRYMPAISNFVKDSDLLVCEAMYGDKADLEKAVKNTHMLFEEAAKIAKRGRVHKLLLTHFSPSLERPRDFLKNATKVFPNTIVGKDGLFFTMNYRED